MVTKIQKWGNSLAVRLPKAIIQKLNLKEGGEVAVRDEAEQIVIQQMPSHTTRVSKNVWKQFLIPTKKKEENVSGTIDQILYGVSH